MEPNLSIRKAAMRVTVLLPVMDETASLRQTVTVLLTENRSVISEILVLVGPRTAAPALATAHDLEQEYAPLLRVCVQQRPHLGGAIRDGFAWAAGTHVVMMASDLETDPALVKELIAAAAGGADIVTATRWARGGGFQGYSPLKFTLNRIFQRLFGALYGTRLSDLTYGFRIFKIEWAKNVDWEELRHPFLLETLLKPLRLGAGVAEIPTTWRVRLEGQSHNPFPRNFSYVSLALRTRLRRRHKLWARP